MANQDSFDAHFHYLDPGFLRSYLDGFATELRAAGYL